ncbi:MAG: hypothetical protein LUG98_14485, partial [Tannerellaceae bacterium]|nr:hypothetical protein [Tannerellaceae bacterium]
IIFSLLVGIAGCKSNKKEPNNYYLSGTPVIEEVDLSEIYIPVEPQTRTQETRPDGWEQFDFIRDLEVKTFPYTESTDFDNYSFTYILTPEEKQLLQLDELLEEIAEINLSYRLEYSGKFLTVVINYFRGEHELFTQLINYNENLKIIDHSILAYDEIAESATRIASELLRDGFRSIHTNSWETPPTIEETTYQIKENGKIEPTQ